MTVRATILIPTHDHGPTLRHSVASALNQSVSSIEVLIVGDGAPDITRQVVAELSAADDRVRYFDNPKGPRHGEIHRHAALAEARGEIVCYLSDDDLYLPDHVEVMLAALDNADFAHALPIRIAPDDSVSGWICDLSLPFHIDLIRSGRNRIPLSCGAHRQDFYRALPHGWRTTPKGVATDLHMWQQILGQPGVRAASTFRPTVAHFPSPLRHDMSIDERCAELARWSVCLESPEELRRWRERIIAHVARESADLERRYIEAAANRDIHKQRYDEISGSVAIRLRDRVRSIPGRSLLRWVARALAGPAER